MERGAQTPEELEMLLEDAALLRDAAGLAALFNEGAVLASGNGERDVRGRDEIAHRLVSLTDRGLAYVAHPRRVIQARDLALVVAADFVNVVCRRRDGTWKFTIASRQK